MHAKEILLNKTLFAFNVYNFSNSLFVFSSGPDGRTQNDSNSLTVTMEVNGIMYQGLLFAVPNQRNRL